jgi:hypothetical protein
MTDRFPAIRRNLQPAVNLRQRTLQLPGLFTSGIDDSMGRRGFFSGSRSPYRFFK